MPDDRDMMPPPVAPPALLPSPLPPDAVHGGLAFHRLVFARRRSGWWTPLAVGALGTAFYVALMIVIVIIVIVSASIDATLMDRLLAFGADTVIDVTDPMMLAFVLGTVAIMLPCYLAASRIVNGPRLGLASSAAGRLRWRWMLWCALLAAAISVVLIAVTMIVFPADASSAPPPDSALWPVSLIVLLLFVPVQAAAEEYVFRGYLMQAIGRWLRHPAFAILLPVPLFVAGHFYDVIGLTGVALFALAAGWLTWRTGGLEAAIALHVVNNLSSFLLALAGEADTEGSAVSLESLVWSVLLIGGYVAIVEWRLHRRPLPRTLVLTPPRAPVYAAAMPSASRIV